MLGCNTVHSPWFVIIMNVFDCVLLVGCFRVTNILKFYLSPSLSPFITTQLRDKHAIASFDSPLKGCSARLVSLSILSPSPSASLELIYAATRNDSIWQRNPVIHHSLAKCIARDEALALSFLYSH